MDTGTHENLRDLFQLLNNDETFIDIIWKYEQMDSKFFGWDLAGKLAIISYESLENKNMEELLRRLKKLYNLGFKFGIDIKWESYSNAVIMLNNNDCFKRIKEMYDIKIISGSIHQSNENLYLPWFWYLMQKKHKEKQYNFNHTFKTYDFLYLNKQKRTHRELLFDALSSGQLLGQSIVTYHDRNIFMDKKYEFKQFRKEDYPRYGMDQDIFELPYNDTAASIVCETSVDDKEIFITEKVFKAIIAEHLYFVLGNPGTLTYLYDSGFEKCPVTSTSYDSIVDLKERIKALTNGCRDFTKIDYIDAYDISQEVRKKNKRHLFDIRSLRNEMNKSWLGFLKFIESGQVSS